MEQLQRSLEDLDKLHLEGNLSENNLVVNV